MKLKKIIKYVLNKAGVTNAQMATTNVEDIILGTHDDVNFNYATAGGSTHAAVYDNTVDFKITVSGNTASGAIVYITSSTINYLVNADAKGEVHVHVLDGPYHYAVYATTSGITDASGVFTASTTGTISIAV